jgi:hypothetical protein
MRDGVLTTTDADAARAAMEEAVGCAIRVRLAPVTIARDDLDLIVENAGEDTPWVCRRGGHNGGRSGCCRGLSHFRALRQGKDLTAGEGGE